MASASASESGGAARAGAQHAAGRKIAGNAPRRMDLVYGMTPPETGKWRPRGRGRRLLPDGSDAKDGVAGERWRGPGREGEAGTRPGLGEARRRGRRNADGNQRHRDGS